MIFDNIKNISRYNYYFKEITDFLQKVDFSCIASNGIVIEEYIKILINNYYTEKNIDNIFENHIECIDFHFIISGEERIVFAPTKNLRTYKEYDVENDYELYIGDGNEDSIVLKEKDFCIFYPGEAHKPGMRISDESCSVNKIVFKIKLKGYEK